MQKALMSWKQIKINQSQFKDKVTRINMLNKDFYLSRTGNTEQIIPRKDNDRQR